MKPEFTPLFDWNQLSIEDCIKYLKDKYCFSSSGDAKCIYTLIEAYEGLTNETKMNDKQKEVIDAIVGERNFQDEMVANTDRPDMIEDLHVGDTIAAMQYNLDLARVAWYQGSAPHQGAMEYLRKVCALGVQAGEKYGMPPRVVTSLKCPYHKNVPINECKESCVCKVKSDFNDSVAVDYCPKSSVPLKKIDCTFFDCGCK